MSPEKKNNMKNFVSTWLTPSLILGAIVMGAWIGGQMKADANTRMFENAQQKEKTKSHIDSDYNEVKNYQLMEQVTEMKVELDTAYAFVNAMFKEDREAKIIATENNADAIKSRAKRDSNNVATARKQDSISKAQTVRLNNIEREQRITANAVQLILSNQNKILDTIN